MTLPKNINILLHDFIKQELMIGVFNALSGVGFSSAVGDNTNNGFERIIRIKLPTPLLLVITPTTGAHDYQMVSSLYFLQKIIQPLLVLSPTTAEQVATTEPLLVFQLQSGDQPVHCLQPLLVLSPTTAE